jgi:molybdopterin converting factor subunit 1
MNLTVLFFATAKEKAGNSRISIQLSEGAKVSDLKHYLVENIPGFRSGLGPVLVSVNHQYTTDEQEIPNGAEVAIFPPVSGGNDDPTVVEITTDEIVLNEILKKITLPTTGGICFFTGVVRGQSPQAEHPSTSYLEYEAYAPMAREKMLLIAQEIRAKWADIQGIAMMQRIGILVPGTPTVVIACSAAHRYNGIFEAASYGIDRLKEIVPIWKKEAGPDGDYWVEGEYFPSEKD